MSMFQLTSNKKRYILKNFLFIFITLYLYGGCSSVKSLNLAQNIDEEQLSCSGRAKPKSLQLLEQQYRCTSQE